MALGASISFWRRLRGKKQKELAESCGWPPARISKYETGRAWPDDQSVELVAAKLGISAEDLRRTQRVLFEHMLAVAREPRAIHGTEDSADAGTEVREPPPESSDLSRRWEELRRREGEVRADRDQLAQETYEALVRTALASHSPFSS